jgi:hypothetical protein
LSELPVEVDENHDLEFREEVDIDDEDKFNPTGLNQDQLNFLVEHAEQDDKVETAQTVSELVRSLPYDHATVELKFVETHRFFSNMLRKVPDRVSTAGTEAVPTMTLTEHDQHQVKDREKDQGGEQVPSTFRPDSETGTIPPRSDNTTRWPVHPYLDNPTTTTSCP